MLWSNIRLRSSVSTRMAAPKKQMRHKNRPITMDTMIPIMGRQTFCISTCLVNAVGTPPTSTCPLLTPLISIRYSSGMISCM